jgi:hypothetical protein
MAFWDYLGTRLTVPSRLRFHTYVNATTFAPLTAFLPCNRQIPLRYRPIASQGRRNALPRRRVLDAARLLPGAKGPRDEDQDAGTRRYRAFLLD